MGVAPQPCGNWREDATRVSRQTGVGLHLASISGKKNLFRALGKKTCVLLNTELQADLQSHVLLGHRGLDTA